MGTFRLTISYPSISQLWLGEPINAANGDVIARRDRFQHPQPRHAAGDGPPVRLVQHGGLRAPPGRTAAWATAGRSPTATQIVPFNRPSTGQPAGTLVWFTDTGIRLEFHVQQRQQLHHARDGLRHAHRHRLTWLPLDRQDRRDDHVHQYRSPARRRPTSPRSPTATATASRSHRRRSRRTTSTSARSATWLTSSRRCLDVHLHGQPHHVDQRLHRPHLALRLRFRRAAGLGHGPHHEHRRRWT